MIGESHRDSIRPAVNQWDSSMFSGSILLDHEIITELNIQLEKVTFH